MGSPRFPHNLDLTNTFDENTGIVQTFTTAYDFNVLDHTSEADLCKLRVDPVAPHNRDARKPIKPLPPIQEEKKIDTIEPTVSTRLKFGLPYEGVVGTKYVVHPKNERKMKAERRKQYAEDMNFCEYDIVRLPSPTITSTVTEKVELISPEVSKAKVVPARPSFVSPSATYPPPPSPSTLEDHKPKSGIFINEVSESSSEGDYEDGRRKKKKKKKKVEDEAAKKEPTFEELDEEYEMFGHQDEGDEDVENLVLMENKSVQLSDNVILGKYGEILSNASSATSVHYNELAHYDDISWCDLPVTSKLVQTLREAQIERTKKKYKKGALENHSFTKLKQSTLEDFGFCSTLGTIHQDDVTFLKVSRNRQGICMPVTAFCFAQLYKPKTWTPRHIDEIVEIGNNLYLDSVGELHMGKNKRDITVDEIQKFVIIRDKKVKFEILPPEVKGLVRSTDKRIYNISRGLRIFFLKYKACIFRACNTNVLIFKIKRNYYFFDATPRKANLFQDPNGAAIIAKMPRLKAIITILLDRTSLENSHFNICEIRLLTIMGKDEKDVEPYVTDLNTYVIVNERQAVVQASYELGNYCFGFTRNKQALAMAAVALVYSRITPPSSWHRKTLDKIIVIGNQLHNLCMETECCCDVCIDHLPSVFTVGPYIVEIHIAANRQADFMFKKNLCPFREHLENFFTKNAHVIVQIGKSYISIWKQRNMFYCFDPYNRNKDGLKCRVGTAVVTMNKDLDVLIDTILLNFENPEAVFFLHALKILKIQRDLELSKIFPKHVPLNQVPLQKIKNQKMRKSKRKATDKSITADCKQHALKKLLDGELMQSSHFEISSNVVSLNSYYLPAFDAKMKMITDAVHPEPPSELLVDLDSPSLSDTQILPKRPLPTDEEEIGIDDLDAFALTEEEKELQETGEDEGYHKHLYAFGMEEQGLEEQSEARSRYGVMSEVTSAELDPCYRTHFINTDLTYCYKILPALELPMKTLQDHELVIDEEDQKEQFEKKRNFVDVNPDMQLLAGHTNAIKVAEFININDYAPYACIMATAYAQELPLHKWEAKTVDFVLKAGKELYNQYQESFQRIQYFVFELEKMSFSVIVDLIFNTYIGDGLFETFSGLKVLEQFLEMHIFNKEDCGFIIMPFYACAVFFKRNLFYLFEPFNCDRAGRVLANDQMGTACLMRFKDLDSLTSTLVNNLSKRVHENDKSELEFRMLTLAKPSFMMPSNIVESFSMITEEMLRETQSLELKRPSNFVTLPDGSQLVSATKKVNDFGIEIEYLAPFMCIMASPVGEKYALRTWSPEILDFILTGGHQLYKKTKFRFDQLAQLDIPKVSLGKTDYKIEVEYLKDAPMTVNIMKSGINKVIEKEREWAIVTTEIYSCAIFQRNALFYLFDPFSCNKLGLDDGSDGLACLARFRTLHDLCIRILFNKNKREAPDKVDYTRFILTRCKASRIFLSKKQKKSKLEKEIEKEMLQQQGEDYDDKEKAEEEEGAEEEGGEGVEEAEAEEKPPNPIGYQKKADFYIIEGSRSLPVPEPDQVELGADHFAALVACLVLVNRPIDKWDLKTVDRVLNIGENVFSFADSIDVAPKRTIRNILIGKHFFDVIVSMLKIADYKKGKNINRAFKYIMRKRKYIILQLESGTYVIYTENLGDGPAHLFRPYATTFEYEDANKEKREVKAKAGWIRFNNINMMKKYLASKGSLDKFTFYSFQVIQVTKAPRSLIISAQIQEYIRLKAVKEESLGKPFHEHESWMCLHSNPWARVSEETASGAERGKAVNKWFHWDIEYPKDLFSLVGTIHQTSRQFKSSTRGKQTLANIILAIGMTGIYELREWNSVVIDNLIRAGDKYFKKCIGEIKEENYELSMDDLLPDCKIYPYTFKIHFTPIVEGTMFLNNPRKFNLYKALRYFFEDFYFRAGVICAAKNNEKRIVGFGKRKENEYFMFDSQAFGPPMFWQRQGVAYCLRCTTLARLIHVLVLTLRGGDFFIYEVVADNFKVMEEEDAEFANASK